MPHQCIRCGTIYEEADVVFKGCSKCRGRLFYFFKEKPKQIEIQLDKAQVNEIEKEIKDIIGENEDKPVILDLEAIRAIKPGKYEIDLVKLFKGSPVIYKLEEGKYIIDIASTFQLMKESKK
ncbi:MAG: Zn-ribbon containing protein [Candidatus Pacearchaeota archaeon]